MMERDPQMRFSFPRVTALIDRVAPAEDANTGFVRPIPEGLIIGRIELRPGANFAPVTAAILACGPLGNEAGLAIGRSEVCNPGALERKTARSGRVSLCAVAPIGKASAKAVATTKITNSRPRFVIVSRVQNPAQRYPDRLR